MKRKTDFACGTSRNYDDITSNHTNPPRMAFVLCLLSKMGRFSLFHLHSTISTCFTLPLYFVAVFFCSLPSYLFLFMKFSLLCRICTAFKQFAYVSELNHWSACYTTHPIYHTRSNNRSTACMYRGISDDAWIHCLSLDFREFGDLLVFPNKWFKRRIPSIEYETTFACTHSRSTLLPCTRRE